MAQKEKIAAVEKAKKQRRSSPWRDAGIRLRRNKAAMVGLAIIFLLLFCAFFPDVVAPYGYDDQDYSQSLQGPSALHIMGTDSFGRDIFSRIVYGTRISLAIGFVSVIVSVIVGGALGAWAAFYGKKTDTIIMRAIDILMAIPSLLLAISIAAALGTGFVNMLFAISIGGIPTYARIVRASVLTVKEQEFVEAARAIGASDRRLILKHILPNVLAPIIVQATLGIAGGILSAASLSFLGLGIQPPTPEWGSMLSSGRQYIQSAWYIVTFPGLTIMLTIFALNLFGDGLRDALDPRLKR